MPLNLCERCKRTPKRIDGNEEYFDYCAKCSRDLCPDCAEHGCCGQAPMASGTESDFSAGRQFLDPNEGKTEEAGDF